ncbi:ABC transporter ATP-binding protein [Caloramator australicus]|uniref:Ferrichrome transport ATP-binding protein FhuC (TC 3.A.1.14.3) n=1 Tax=Caloramator australicus RC3 TaxID=857293 RepID=G0V3R4_9CLOT|nr:ABC transporter ATP-binding protein [Caloramator australicus]CCC57754.1 Ferrichrome transport ATP-binding protein FhuC (TC 3.A.1.14.3) [Caloramator australicus RC3]
MHIIKTENLSIAYDNYEIVRNLNLNIPKGKITAIIGANGCGKSTILKTIARVINPKNGKIYIKGEDILEKHPKEIAKIMAFLPQSPVAPLGLCVEDLVSYGRFPYKSGFGSLNKDDREIIDWSIDVVGMKEFKDRPLEELSGGQRQRAWIAMALAQQTEILLLDEPTTYLDIQHQLEILRLLEQLNKKEKRTIVMVIHELNNAARFSDYIIGIKSGKIVCEGKPEDVITKENLREIFNIDAEIIYDSKYNKPVCVTYDLMS